MADKVETNHKWLKILPPFHSDTWSLERDDCDQGAYFDEDDELDDWDED